MLATGCITVPWLLLDEHVTIMPVSLVQTSPRGIWEFSIRTLAVCPLPVRFLLRRAYAWILLEYYTHIKHKTTLLGVYKLLRRTVKRSGSERERNVFN